MVPPSPDAAGLTDVAKAKIRGGYKYHLVPDLMEFSALLIFLLSAAEALINQMSHFTEFALVLWGCHHRGCDLLINLILQRSPTCLCVRFSYLQRVGWFPTSSGSQGLRSGKEFHTRSCLVSFNRSGMQERGWSWSLLTPLYTGWSFQIPLLQPFRGSAFLIKRSFGKEVGFSWTLLSKLFLLRSKKGIQRNG